MSKKRKADSAELDMERTLYSSFVTAANAVSQLYAQGVQQQRRSASTASRTMLVGRPLPGVHCRPGGRAGARGASFAGRAWGRML